MNNQSLRTFFATGSGVTAMIFFSLYSIFGKMLLEHFPPHTLILLGQSLSLLVLLLFFGVVPEIKTIFHIPHKQKIWILLVSILSGVIIPFLSFSGLQHIQANEAVLLGGMSPIFLGVLGVLFLNERISAQQIGGFTCLLIGLAIIAMKGSINTLDVNIGYIFITMACFLTAVSNTLFKRFLSDIQPQIVVLLRNTTGAIFLSTLFPFFSSHNHNFQALTQETVLLPLILYALLVIMGAQILWYKSLEILSATQASLMYLLNPLFGVFFAVVILGEMLFSHHIWGGLCIFTGLILTQLHHHNHPHNHILHRIKHISH